MRTTPPQHVTPGSLDEQAPSLHSPRGASRDGLQPLRARWDPLAEAPQRAGRAPRATRPGVRRRSRLGWVVSVYGWRVFAVPVLAVVTVLAVLDATGAPSTPPSPAVAAAAVNGDSGGGFRAHSTTGTGSPISGPVADGSFDPATAAGTLPDGGLYPITGAGTWHVVGGTTPRVGAPNAPLTTYTVEVEDGIDTTAFGGDAAVASVVEHTLAAAQGWTHDGKFAFQRIDTATPTIRISLTSRAPAKSRFSRSAGV